MQLCELTIVCFVIDKNNQYFGYNNPNSESGNEKDLNGKDCMICSWLHWSSFTESNKVLSASVRVQRCAREKGRKISFDRKLRSERKAQFMN